MRRPLGGPGWQQLEPGARVTPIGGRKRGTVIGIVEPRGPGGVTQQVLVQWDRGVNVPRVWPTDFLVVVDEKGETA